MGPPSTSDETAGVVVPVVIATPIEITDSNNSNESNNIDDGDEQPWGIYCGRRCFCGCCCPCCNNRRATIVTSVLGMIPAWVIFLGLVVYYDTSLEFPGRLVAAVVQAVGSTLGYVGALRYQIWMVACLVFVDLLTIGAIVGATFLLGPVWWVIPVFAVMVVATRVAAAIPLVRELRAGIVTKGTYADDGECCFGI